MTDQPQAHADESIRAEAGSNQTVIRLVGMDQPFFTALAVVLSIVAIGLCAFTEMREERRVYFTMRCEGFVEQLAFEQKPVNPSQLHVICGPREK